MNIKSGPISHELHRLFVAKADGTITPEDHERLGTLLKESAEARREWFAFQDAEAALQEWSQREALRGETAADVAMEKSAVREIARGSRGRSWRYAGTLAAGIAIGLVTWALWPRQPQERGPALLDGANLAVREEATSASVAVLARGVNMEWEGGDAPAVNSPLPPGVLRLRSGVAEIEFFQGARLCVEGPAEIRLVSAGEAFCTSGRFSANVPPQAKGFRIGTPKGDIVDLGTEFGLDLNKDAPELHVFKGEVELHQPKGQVRTLTEGVAAALKESDTPRMLMANAAAFAFSQDLDARVNASQRQAFERWQEAGERWNADPDVRLRFDFQDKDGSRSLRNVAESGDIPAGSIVGSIWTEGRWPGKRALQFRSVSDRVRLSLPGEYPQMTLSAWVQVHSLTSRQSSLLMCEGWEPGEMHWQILADGSLCLGIASEGGERKANDYISPVVFTPERLGQWVHLAVTYDTAAGEVRHYVDGKCISQHPMSHRVVLKPGLAELGNWNPAPEWRQRPVRNFVGCMDEFSFLARALTDAEVFQLAR